MSQTPFPVLPELTAVALAHKNKKLIADLVSVRIGQTKREFRYTKYTTEESFTVPETRVGRKGKPNEVEFTGTPVDSSVEDYGLDDPVPQSDIADAAGTNIDPLKNAVMGVANLIDLDREVRVATQVFATANYATANKTTLSGTSQLSDFANSDPIGVVLAGLDACLARPNIMVIGQAAYTKLVQHPKIVKAVLGNAGDSGVATREAIARLFELDQVVVGEGWVNTAKKGQTPTMARVWGKHIALLHNDPNPNIEGQMAMFWTAQWGTRIAGSQADSSIGVYGGQRVRVAESVKEVCTSTDLGYLIINAVA